MSNIRLQKRLIIPDLIRLDLPVYALIDELVAGVCKSLALVPVFDIKPVHIRMIGENLVCDPMEIVLSLPVVYFVKQLSDNLHAISNSIDCIDEHMM